MKTLICILAAGWLLNGYAQDNSETAASELPDDLKRNLVLYFSFDRAEASGVVTDKSGHGNDGQAVGAQWTQTGHRGGGFQFGPTNSYITVSNSLGLNPPQFTLAVWIKTSYKDKFWRRIFDKGYGHGYDLTMGGDDNGKTWQGQMFFEVVTAAAGTRTPVTDGQWHHVAGVFDAEQLQLYVDGKRVGTVRAKGQPVPTMYDLTIGQNRSNANQASENGHASFVGMMDDVMMFNRALSVEEVQELFAAQGGVLAAQPASTSSVAAPTKPDAAERLKKVKALYDQGLINKDDYDKKVKEIMDSL